MIRSFTGWIWPYLLLFVVATGCTPPPESAAQRADSPQIQTSSQLQQNLDEVLDFTLQERELNTSQHGAWQILHGALAYQKEFPVRIGRAGPFQSAVDYVLEGGTMLGWTFQPGNVLDPASGRRGLRAIVEPGTKKGQGHADQWLAILAQCDLPLDQTILLGKREFTLADLVDQVKYDAPFNAQSEWSWTLIGLTHYGPTTAEWKASDGEMWSIERMLQAELDQDVDGSACGGTHRLIGIATALRRRQAEGLEVTGVWQTAQQRVEQAILRTLEFQNPDGSLSSQYWRRPSHSPDMAIVLGSTGHLLEFLTVAMSDEQLQNPQVTLAVQHLCSLLRSTRDLPLECGALYHATHGLVLYRQRMFGPRDYRFQPPATPDAS